MKKILKTLGFLPIAISLLTGCGNKNIIIDDRPTLPVTKYNLVIHGVSEHAILRPDELDANTQFALDDFQAIFKQATGIELKIYTFANIPRNIPVISFGDNELAREKAVAIPAGSRLETSGYYIKTVEDSIFVLAQPGSDHQGLIFGGYRILEDAFNLKIFAHDEIVTDFKENVPLYAYDEVYLPSFDEREIGYYTLRHNTQYRRRMRLISRVTDQVWSGAYGHSQVHYALEWNKYQSEHPDWYSGTATLPQLCWTAGEEMENEFARVFYDRWIAAFPNATYFMLGQEDNEMYCSCERCRQAIRDYAGSNSGLQLIWANRVVEKMNAIIAEEAPHRLHKVKFLIYAYQGTMEAPVKTNPDGSYAPYSDHIKVHEDLYVEFTPITTDFSHSLRDEENRHVYEALKGWQSVAAGQIMLYTYDTNFKNYYVNFNNFATWTSHMRDYLDNGVYYFYSQGPTDTSTAALEEMRIYVESSLLWDASRNYDELVREFMDGYYKEAGEAMCHYYALQRDRYAVYTNTIKDNIGGIYAAIGAMDVWPEHAVAALENCIESALEAIKVHQDQDYALYEKLHNRIKRQYLTVLYLQLSNYAASFSQSQLNNMVNEFHYYSDMFGIKNYSEIISREGLFLELVS